MQESHVGIILLHFAGPPVPITARVHSTPQEAQVYSHDGPIRCGKRRYILVTDQSPARCSPRALGRPTRASGTRTSHPGGHFASPPSPRKGYRWRGRWACAVAAVLRHAPGAHSRRTCEDKLRVA
eukprot:1183194-Prorocentrum_minimum.AAC.1